MANGNLAVHRLQPYFSHHYLAPMLVVFCSNAASVIVTEHAFHDSTLHTTPALTIRMTAKKAIDRHIFI